MARCATKVVQRIRFCALLGPGPLWGNIFGPFWALGPPVPGRDRPGPAGDESYVILEQKKDFGADFGRFPAKNDRFLAFFRLCRVIHTKGILPSSLPANIVHKSVCFVVLSLSLSLFHSLSLSLSLSLLFLLWGDTARKENGNVWNALFRVLDVIAQLHVGPH